MAARAMCASLCALECVTHIRPRASKPKHGGVRKEKRLSRLSRAVMRIGALAPPQAARKRAVLHVFPSATPLSTPSWRRGAVSRSSSSCC